MESYHYVVDRLLKLGRLDDALAEAKHVENYDILEIADILSEHGHEDKAVQLIEELVERDNDTDLLHWLQERYQSRGNLAGAMEMAKPFAIYRFYTNSWMDLDDDTPGLLVSDTTPEERQIIASWVQDALKHKAAWSISQPYETLLVAFEEGNKRS